MPELKDYFPPNFFFLPLLIHIPHRSRSEQKPISRNFCASTERCDYGRKKFLEGKLKVACTVRNVFYGSVIIFCESIFFLNAFWKKFHSIANGIFKGKIFIHVWMEAKKKILEYTFPSRVMLFASMFALKGRRIEVFLLKNLLFQKTKYFNKRLFFNSITTWKIFPFQ